MALFTCDPGFGLIEKLLFAYEIGPTHCNQTPSD